jgi:hypothetical protein
MSPRLASTRAPHQLESVYCRQPASALARMRSARAPSAVPTVGPGLADSPSHVRPAAPQALPLVEHAFARCDNNRVPAALRTSEHRSSTLSSAGHSRPVFWIGCSIAAGLTGSLLIVAQVCGPRVCLDGFGATNWTNDANLRPSGDRAWRFDVSAPKARS